MMTITRRRTRKGWLEFNGMTLRSDMLDLAETFLSACEAEYIEQLGRPPTMHEVWWLLETQLRARSLAPGRRLSEPWEMN